MIFGDVPLDQAEGAILAHSMPAVKDGQPHRIAKGTVLTADHLRALAEAGRDHVVVARLGADDIEENAAALELAQALVPDAATQGLRISGAGAGRVNLYATTPGVAVMDVAAINALNAVHPMITLATVPQYHRCDAGGMVATIKIIAYGVPREALAQAATAGRAALHIAPPRYATATLVESQVAGATPSTKGREAMAGRLERLDMTLTPRVVCDHTTEALAQAIAQAAGDVVLVLTASATSDPDDVAPQALRVAGGQVAAFGMPVDPGNLLFFGAIGDKPVIGLPGCARSPALNGADWVLERLVCGLTLDQGDISAMGVGGLLKEIPTRPRPRSASKP
ncbi:molybdenum cofactor cytidylyltransferase [Pseudosulfitobacter pseudonitzschiae]|uniref:Molybdopterin biosynthesis protein n=1 Tax=Pseudosulfitobacter pseudonitzschiae TaxID=1402135 RepID=A0A073J7A0_9RHOB|nr:molybdopterin-binding protein [Pseudosulfitobacter pseudonitzschiae]KEJ97849.1 molybdopterin biosynthesis protein [Pseudosulfitobacter pseudonitzschiae]QKS09108.1 molybdopterin-binding protein [Pseudosulfitobacter pseudonitzschiae]SHE55821.1 molybdenum cofactor cytidylyltransferase [Pseudosulfitobacter pseudonitzschiae]